MVYLKGLLALQLLLPSLNLVCWSETAAGFRLSGGVCICLGVLGSILSTQLAKWVWQENTVSVGGFTALLCASVTCAVSRPGGQWRALPVTDQGLNPAS